MKKVFLLTKENVEAHFDLNDLQWFKTNEGFIYVSQRIFCVKHLQKNASGDLFFLVYKKNEVLKEIEISATVFSKLAARVEYWNPKVHYLLKDKNTEIEVVFFTKQKNMIFAWVEGESPPWMFGCPDITTNSGYLAFFISHYYVYVH